MCSREKCIEHTKSVVTGTFQPPVLAAGMFVELHCNCSIDAAECDAEEVQLLRHRGDGWWFIGDNTLVHEQELIVPE